MTEDTRTIEEIRNAAEQGDAEAQYDLAWCYFTGRKISENEKEAVQWFRKSAEGGHAPAQRKLGDLYFKGRKFGVQTTIPDVAQLLGNVYDDEYIDEDADISKDQAEAVKWYRKAAEQGDAWAQDELGDCYFNGTGVPEDKVEAVKWYHRAAEGGSRGAASKLGECYFHGWGVSQNMAEAEKWFDKAIEREHMGVASELRKLAKCCIHGVDVLQDITEAEKWLRKAVGNKDDRFDLFSRDKFDENDLLAVIELMRKLREE
jgi:TPR repeat protein